MAFASGNVGPNIGGGLLAGQNDATGGQNSALWGVPIAAAAGGLGYWAWKRYPRETAQMPLFPRGELPERSMLGAMGRDIDRAWAYVGSRMSRTIGDLRYNMGRHPQQLELPFGAAAARNARGVGSWIGRAKAWGGNLRTGAIWGVPDIMRGRPIRGLSRVGRGIGSGWKMGFGSGWAGWGFGLVAGGVGAGLAPRGHRVSTFAGATMGWMLGALIGGAIAGPVGATVGMFVGTTALEGVIAKPIQFLHDYATMTRHLGMGGWYEDTYPAYTMRQRAVREMSASLLNARQYLGREALLLHQ